MNTVVSLPSSRPKGGAPESAGMSEPTTETRWSGEFNRSELARDGAYLISALHRRADELGQTLNEMCRHLGVTYGYINQMRNGLRSTKAISEDFSYNCARYLGVPRMTVLVLAGVVSMEDLYARVNLWQAEVPRAMAYLCEDMEWGPLVTQEIREGSPQTQYLVLRLYEDATGRKLLPERLDLQKLAESFGLIRAYRENMLKEAAPPPARSSRKGAGTAGTGAATGSPDAGSGAEGAGASTAS
ncbi:hypothetical protein D3C71_23990 [compost metagenome]